jgi:hypothetical protein
MCYSDFVYCCHFSVLYLVAEQCSGYKKLNIIFYSFVYLAQSRSALCVCVCVFVASTN